MDSQWQSGGPLPSFTGFLVLSRSFDSMRHLVGPPPAAAAAAAAAATAAALNIGVDSC